ncbi:Rha family transcriptional regulator [Providencia alcalifaciens]|nr:Rha family transcriptional regulator [Providencia alcalifaciens]MTC74965.1 Rha family transcriptional regulator [Providencia sp. wls1919]MTC75509.1 Rha family transcriptional regulator [Providencia sp. wls1919]
MSTKLVTHTDLDLRAMISAKDGEPVTDTFKIAEVFNRRHADVLRALAKCHCSDEFRAAHFFVSEKINELGIFDKKQKYYVMDFSGFVMLVMGFSGSKAGQIKEAYINAFNWMKGKLSELNNSLEAESNAVMLEYMKEKDVASMSGRLLNRWGRVKKPQLLSRISKLEQKRQLCISFASEQK